VSSKPAAAQVEVLKNKKRRVTKVKHKKKYGSGKSVIVRETLPTGGSTRHRSAAIGAAYREAAEEKLRTGFNIEVWVEQNDRRTKEWPG
jgi:hypothetical protein